MPIWRLFRNCTRYATRQQVTNKTYTLKPRFTNASDHEQFGLRKIFRTQSVSDDVLCLELRTRKPSTETEKRKRIPFQTVTFHFLTTFHLRRQLSSSPPSTYAVNSPPYRDGKTKLNFRLYLICLVLCLSFLR